MPAEPTGGPNQTPNQTPTERPASSPTVGGWPEPKVDLGGVQSLHIVGIGGAGMSAIATVLASMGHRVTGSDLKASRVTARLEAAGIPVVIGHDAANLGPDVAAVTISTAIPERNPEVVEARRRGLAVLRRAETLAAIAAQRRTVAVAGTHGKTTTSSMLSVILLGAGVGPSFIIGGDVNEIGTGAGWGSGDLFVVEADESDGTFLELPRHAALVTNVEPDHIEHYGGVDALFAAFERFLAATPGPRIVCADDELAARFGAAAGATTYGTTVGSTHQMTRLRTAADRVAFDVSHPAYGTVAVEVPMPGAHNARNACGAFAAAVELGIDPGAAAAALARFAGVARRFEHRGAAAGVTFVDDYAHLPTEVAAAVGAARDGGWDRIVVVFQPHRYSRTAALWQDFAGSFAGADLLVVTDIYPSGEASRPGVTGHLIVNAVQGADPRQPVEYKAHRDELVDFLAGELRPGDLCLTLGAGDLTSVPDDLLDRLGGRAP